MATVGPNDIEARLILTTDELKKSTAEAEKAIKTMSDKAAKDVDKTKKVFDAWNFSLNAIKLGLKALKFVMKDAEQAQIDLAAAQTVFGDAADTAYIKAKEGAGELLRVLGEVADAFGQGIFGGPKINFFANMAKGADEFSIRAKAAEIRIGKLKTTLADLEKVPLNILEAGIITGFDEGSEEWRNVADFYSKWRQEIVDTAQESVDLETQIQGFIGKGFSADAAKKIVTSYAALRKSIADDREKRQAEDEQLEIESAERVAAAFAEVNKEEAERAAKLWADTFEGGFTNAVQSLEDEFLNLGKAADRFAKEAHATISDNLFKALTGEAVDFAEVLRGFLLSIVRQSTDAAGAGFLGLFKGLAPSAGLSGAGVAAQGAGGSGSVSLGAASEFAAIPQYGQGAHVDKPHLAIVGDEPETIIPDKLLKGMRGGSGDTFVFSPTIQAIDGASVAALFARRDFQDQFRASMVNAASKNRTVRG